MGDLGPRVILGHEAFVRRAQLDPPLTLDWIDGHPTAHWSAIAHYLGSTPEGEITHDQFSLTYIGEDGRIVAWTVADSLRDAVSSAEANGVKPSDWEAVSVETPDDPEDPVEWPTER